MNVRFGPKGTKQNGPRDRRAVPEYIGDPDANANEIHDAMGFRELTEGAAVYWAKPSHWLLDCLERVLQHGAEMKTKG
ncbi:MAG: hypothetical protein KKB02_10730 [Alphaproteobacteria bacterium]|nr:hypothetical protein [Alphaproteobacteria bacterium]